MKAEYLADGSPDCPLIRLFDFDEVGAEGLRRVFDSLAEGANNHVDITDIPGMDGISGCRIGLAVSAKDRGVMPVSGAQTFACLLSVDTWKSLADLTKPFCLNAEPTGYQWLDRASKIGLLLSPDGSW